MPKTNIFTRQMSRLRKAVLPKDEQNGNNIVQQSVGDFLHPDSQLRYIDKVMKIRQLCPNLEEKLRHKKEVAALKIDLPCGVMSGVVSNGIGEEAVTFRNGLIAVDVDGQDNPALYDWEAVKQELAKSPYIAYCGLSVSGLGVFCVLAIADPMAHNEHYRAVVEDFERTTFRIRQGYDTEPTVLRGLRVDHSVSNIAAKRFVSFDPNPIWKCETEVYTRKSIQTTTPPPPRSRTSKGKTFDLEQFFEEHKIPYNIRERGNGVQYRVLCPWHELHSSRSRGESVVFRYDDGRLGFKCFHSHCADRTWKEYRAYYEPTPDRKAAKRTPYDHLLTGFRIEVNTTPQEQAEPMTVAAVGNTDAEVMTANTTTDDDRELSLKEVVEWCAGNLQPGQWAVGKYPPLPWEKE